MNEKQIEKRLIGLRNVSHMWKQTKTQIGKQRIELAARELKQFLTGSLVPLHHGSVDSVLPCRVKIFPYSAVEKQFNIIHKGLIEFNAAEHASNPRYTPGIHALLENGDCSC